MASWILVACLDRLRDDVDIAAPNRSKASDGTIGDTAHQASVSDHNDDEVGRVPIKDADSKHEVHALDLTADLREPGLTMEMIVQHTLSRCRSGAEKRLRYIIYRRRIWEASNKWRERDYTGDSPHTEHAHFSASYETKLEADASSWNLEEIPVALTEADKKWIGTQLDLKINAAVSKLTREIDMVPTEVLGAKTSDPSNLDRTVRNHLVDLSQLRDYAVGADNAIKGAIKATAPVIIQTKAAEAALKGE